MKQKRFTLIELLMVIAVIGILAAMLLPALKVAKDTVQATQCLNLSRTWWHAYNGYKEDWNGYMPNLYGNKVPNGFNAAYYSDYRKYASASFARIVAKEYANIRSYGISYNEGKYDPYYDRYLCPKRNPKTKYDLGKTTYNFNNHFAQRFMSYFMVQTPSRTVFCTEGQGEDGFAIQTYNDVYYGGFNHNDSGSVTFLDGHGEKLHLSKYPRYGNPFTPGVSYWAADTGYGEIWQRTQTSPWWTYFWGGGSYPGTGKTVLGL